jgi:hypothetical protein
MGRQQAIEWVVTSALGCRSIQYRPPAFRALSISLQFFEMLHISSVKFV